MPSPDTTPIHSPTHFTGEPHFLGLCPRVRQQTPTACSGNRPEGWDEFDVRRDRNRRHHATTEPNRPGRARSTESNSGVLRGSLAGLPCASADASCRSRGPRARTRRGRRHSIRRPYRALGATLPAPAPAPAPAIGTVRVGSRELVSQLFRHEFTRTLASTRHLRGDGSRRVQLADPLGDRLLVEEKTGEPVEVRPEPWRAAVPRTREVAARVQARKWLIGTVML